MFTSETSNATLISECIYSNAAPLGKNAIQMHPPLGTHRNKTHKVTCKNIYSIVLKISFIFTNNSCLSTRDSCDYQVFHISISKRAYRQLRARRALLIFKDVPLRTRKAPLLYRVYGDSSLLVLNRTSLNSDSYSALLALNWRYLGTN